MQALEEGGFNNSTTGYGSGDSDESGDGQDTSTSTPAIALKLAPVPALPAAVATHGDGGIVGCRVWSRPGLHIEHMVTRQNTFVMVMLGEAVIQLVRGSLCCCCCCCCCFC
jgi:hypothetical protein